MEQNIAERTVETEIDATVTIYKKQPAKGIYIYTFIGRDRLKDWEQNQVFKGEFMEQNIVERTMETEIDTNRIKWGIFAAAENCDEFHIMLNTGTGHGEIHLIGFHGKSETPTAEHTQKRD